MTRAVPCENSIVPVKKHIVFSPPAAGNHRKPPDPFTSDKSRKKQKKADQISGKKGKKGL
jgi:hypothetical protein